MSCLQFDDQEGWNGIFKAILFVIHCHYDELMQFQCNKTLKFFSELKLDSVLALSLNKRDFKTFVRQLSFDPQLPIELKMRHASIFEGANLKNGV